MEDCFANDYSILEPLERTELINYQLIKKSHKSRVKVIFDKSKDMGTDIWIHIEYKSRKPNKYIHADFKPDKKRVCNHRCTGELLSDCCLRGSEIKRLWAEKVAHDPLFQPKDVCVFNN